MSGRHVGRFGGYLSAPPPPEVHRADVLAGIPQRERVTYLSHLQARLRRDARIVTGFGTVDHAPVLNVMPVRQPGDHGPLPKTVTVACCYDRLPGQWWFYWLVTGERLVPANELDAAARLVLEAVY
ncbi:hypothetical protein ACFQ07_17760 [Actinomadura adrarensis]|uniref:DUF302 domain-containing protein n=1 Tax=Actinomadura adrarensis TaxID=1819600 RepID=A0ABW3CK24_9ACTN